MAYLKRGPWVDGDQIDDADLTAMDDAIAAAQHTAHLDLGSVAGTILIDAATYGSVSLRLTGDATLVVSGLSPTGAVGSLDVYVNVDGHTLTWPTGTVWPGSAPSLVGNPDYVRLIGVGSTVFARHITRYRYNESALPAIGAAFMGGFYAGIMDTIATAPDSRDKSQRRIRYALIVSARSMQADVAGKSWVGRQTAWDGESVEDGYGVVDLAYPRDGASRWYLPSLYELAMLLWIFKPVTTANATGQTALIYVGGPAWSPGTNEFADPALPPFSSSTPGQTALTAFRSGGAQYIGSTTSNLGGLASCTAQPSGGWQFGLGFGTPNGNPGEPTTITADITMQTTIRPVRRLILAEAA